MVRSFMHPPLFPASKGAKHFGLAHAVDVCRTFLAWTNLILPGNTGLSPIDGVSQLGVILRSAPSPRTTIFYSPVAEPYNPVDGVVCTPPKTTPAWVKFLSQMFGGFATLRWIGSIICVVAFGVQKSQDDDDESTRRTTPPWRASWSSSRACVPRRFTVFMLFATATCSVPFGAQGRLSPGKAPRAQPTSEQCQSVWLQAREWLLAEDAKATACGTCPNPKHGLPARSAQEVVGRTMCAGWQPNATLGCLHIGKAGGGMVSASLDASKIRNNQLHMAPADCREGSPFFRHSELLVTLRDPVDRFVSAYNWRGAGSNSASAFEACGSADSMFSNLHGSGNTVVATRRPPLRVRESEHLMRTFRQINCSRFKKQVLAQVSNGFSLHDALMASQKHIFRGYCFHFGGPQCLHLVSKHRIRVHPVFTETMSAELEATLRGLSSSAPEAAVKLKERRHSSDGDKFLSPRSRRALEVALADEHRLVNSILAVSGANRSYCTEQAVLPGVCHDPAEH